MRRKAAFGFKVWPEGSAQGTSFITAFGPALRLWRTAEPNISSYHRSSPAWLSLPGADFAACGKCPAGKGLRKLGLTEALLSFCLFSLWRAQGTCAEIALARAPAPGLSY